MVTQQDTLTAPDSQEDAQARAVRLAIQKAEPKSKLVEALLRFSAQYEEGETLTLCGSLGRELVRQAVDPESHAGPLASNWHLTNKWIESLQGDLAQAIKLVIDWRVRELERAILADLKSAEGQG